MNDKIPWVEKYRPKKFNNIVLSEINKKILENIIKKNNFPNLLLYGQPGTGKTTTIINLIESYQDKYFEKSTANLIHLNASDERGIDTVRNQINMFVNSNTIMNKGLKFVVLDEVDYMTKNAQQALSYLIEQNVKNVRFCLICNYLSRIEISLKEKFILLRFNNLPKNEIIMFLLEICKNEKLNKNESDIENIIKFFKSDIRSMINYLQSNQNNNSNMIEESEINALILLCKKKDNYININEKYNSILDKNKINNNELIKKILKYIIDKKSELVNKELLKLIKYILHSNIELEETINYFLNYLNVILL
jgi:DNA polymerase III delta prime subunit